LSVLCGKGSSPIEIEYHPPRPLPLFLDDSRRGSSFLQVHGASYFRAGRQGYRSCGKDPVSHFIEHTKQSTLHDLERLIIQSFQKAKSALYVGIT